MRHLATALLTSCALSGGLAGAEELLAPVYPGAVPIDERLVELKAVTAREAPSVVLAREAGLSVLLRPARESGSFLWMMTESVQKGLHTQEELDAVAAEYRWLESAYFEPMEDGIGQLARHGYKTPVSVDQTPVR